MNTKANNTNNTMVNNNTMGKEDVKMNNTRMENTVNKYEGLVNKGIANMRMYNFLVSNGYDDLAVKTKAVYDRKMSRKAIIDHSQQKEIKNTIKKEEVVLIRGVELNVVPNNEGYETVLDVAVKPQISSVLTREVGQVPVIMNDKNMCLKRNGNYEFLSVKVGSSVKDATEQNAKDVAFNHLRKGIVVVYSKKTGVAKVLPVGTNIEDVRLKRKQVVVEYKFMAITASGLRTWTMIYAAVQMIDGDDRKNTIDCDRRVELLDATLGGGFKYTFMDEDGMFKKLDKKKAFKLMGRVALGAPGSKEIETLNNYVVFDNIAEKAFYLNEKGESVNCKDTQDGAVYISLEKIMENPEFAIYNTNQLVHQCIQARGANNALKGASEILRRRDVKFLANTLINRGTKIAYVVINGERFENIDELSNEQMEELLNNIDMVADTNAIKIYHHEGAFRVVFMKQAYTSESSLNMVINMMLAAEDPTAGVNLIKKIVKKHISKKFGDFGFNVNTDENGNIVSSEYNLEAVKNNEGQFSSFLYKNDPKLMMYLLPSILRGMINSSLDGIRNILNILKAEMQSLYTVVQSDPAPLFGQRIIQANEVFCPKFLDKEEVSGARHPISGLKAITTFRVLTLKEIFDRIAALKVSADVKEFLYEYYATVKEFAIIPASHYLMEKHDGMDFDIDAMQFVLEEEAVAILKKTKEMGTKIEDSEQEKVDRYITTVAEKRIKRFKETGKCDYLYSDADDHEEEQEAPVAVVDAELDPVFAGNKIETKNKIVKNEDKATMSFDGMLDLTIEYFNSNVDPVGIIATGFYNNALLLSYLTSNDVPRESKEKVAQAFAHYYGCDINGDEYKNQLSESINDEGFIEVLLSKEKCTNIIFAYAASNGSVESTVEFLRECCLGNRYIAETSIDAAKNKYQIIDMFNHTKVVLAMGSDKSLTVKLVQNDSLFKNTVNKLAAAQDKEYDEHNRFNVFMFDHSTDAKGKGIINIDDIKNMKEYFKNEKEIRNAMLQDMHCAVLKPGLGVNDILSGLKKELVNYTNNLVVFAVKELEAFVSNNNLEAFEARKAIVKECKQEVFNNTFIDPQKTIRNMLILIKDVHNGIGSEEEFEEMNSKLFLKDQAVKMFKNTISLIFKNSTTPMSDAQIGLCFLGTVVEMNKKAMESGKLGSTHSAALSVFDKYVLAYLASKGQDVNAYDKVLGAVRKGRTVSLDEYAGQTVVFKDGMAKLDDIVIKAKDKHLNIEGEIVKDECGHAYVKSERALIEEDPSLGMYITMRKQFVSGSYELSTEYARKQLDTLSLQNVRYVNNDLVEVRTSNGNVKKRLEKSIVGEFHAKNGAIFNYHVCELVTPLSLRNVLKADDNAQFGAHYHETKDESGNVTDVSGFVSYNSETLQAALESILNAKEEVIEETVAPEETVEPQDDFFAPVPTEESPLVACAEDFVEVSNFTPIPQEEAEIEEDQVIVNDNVLLGNFQF